MTLPNPSLEELQHELSIAAHARQVALNSAQADAYFQASRRVLHLQQQIGLMLQASTTDATRTSAAAL